MILLDTHALLFWLNDPRLLGKKVRSQIEKNNRIGLHVISCLEISILVEKRKIQIHEELSNWINRMLCIPKIELVQLTPDQAVRSVNLPGPFHRDPVDRILAATCLIGGYPLITKDRLIRNWGFIKTVW